MSHIIEFSIEGLAGRDDIYSQKLDRRLNVFFGLNGSGKTSLLRLLHSAMSTDASMLRTIPYRSAEIVVYSNNHSKSFKYTSVKPLPDPIDSHEASGGSDASEPRKAKKETEPKWIIAPEPPSPAVRWRHEYLPTSRLYFGSGPFMHSPGLREMEGIPDEDQLEAAFEFLVNRNWSKYSAEILGAVRKTHETGLAQILITFLKGRGQERSLDTDYDKAIA